MGSCMLYPFVITIMLFLASSLMPYLTQVRLMVGLLKSVGTGDLTTADGLLLCSSTSPNTFFAWWLMMVHWSEYLLLLMQLREFLMQRRWLLHPVWHLPVVCTLLTWNMIWMLEGKFYLVASVDGPPGFVSCWLWKVYLNPIYEWCTSVTTTLKICTRPNKTSKHVLCYKFRLIKNDASLYTLS